MKPTIDEQINYARSFYADNKFNVAILASLERLKQIEAQGPVEPDAVDAERYRWLCADMPVSDEADARYRVLQRMDMMGKGAIDSEIDNWRIK